MIGEMKHVLRLQERAGTPDDGGGFDLLWEDVAADADVFAEIIPLDAGEVYRFGQTRLRATHRILTRYRGDIDADMRFVDGARVYDIVAVRETDGDRRYLDILAVTGS